MVRLARLLSAALLLWAGVLSGPVWAADTLPADVAARIDQVATSIGPLAYSNAPAGLAGQDARRRAETAMIAVVMSGIVRNPGQHRGIVAYATRQAPALREVVATKAAQSFPGFAADINQAANLTAATAPQVDAQTSAQAQPAQSQAAEGLPEEISDPLEGLNRGTFWFNDALDTVLLRPVAWTYGFITPDFAKDMISNAFDNFNSPVILANDLLQFEMTDAAVTTGRLAINSTVGIAGFFDVAAAWGLPEHHADFGQTLHSYGTPAGPYLVIPVLGPSTVRDGIGSAADSFLHPRTYLFDFIPTNLAISVANGIVVREELIDPLDDLKENSLDYYAALRSAYYQNRAVELNRGEPLPAGGAVEDLFGENF